MTLDREARRSVLPDIAERNVLRTTLNAESRTGSQLGPAGDTAIVLQLIHSGTETFQRGAQRVRDGMANLARRSHKRARLFAHALDPRASTPQSERSCTRGAWSDKHRIIR